MESHRPVQGGPYRQQLGHQQVHPEEGEHTRHRLPRRLELRSGRANKLDEVDLHRHEQHPVRCVLPEEAGERPELVQVHDCHRVQPRHKRLAQLDSDDLRADARRGDALRRRRNQHGGSLVTLSQSFFSFSDSKGQVLMHSKRLRSASLGASILSISLYFGRSCGAFSISQRRIAAASFR